jgi:hypothetical protein
VPGLTRPELRGLCSVWRERGLLSGANRVQTFLLTWTMGQERREEFAVEEDRFKGQVFANNPELFARLFANEQAEVDWIGGEDEEGLRAAGLAL